MRSWRLGLALAAMLAACGGGDKPARETSSAPGAPAVGQPAAKDGSAAEPDRLVSAQAVLLRAAEKQHEVQSFRGTFEISMSAEGETFSIDGEMAFRAPGSMYMTMDLDGEPVEMIMELPDVYVNAPGQGWSKLSFDDLGIDYEQFREYFENRGLLDMSEMSDALGDVEHLADEYIDGQLHEHYRGELDLARLADSLPASTIDPEFFDQALDMIEGATFEFWVNPETQLVRRFAFSMSMPFFGAGQMDMEMSMDFLDVNGDVEIPAPPAHAAPLSRG